MLLGGDIQISSGPSLRTHYVLSSVPDIRPLTIAFNLWGFTGFSISGEESHSHGLLLAGHLEGVTETEQGLQIRQGVQAPVAIVVYLLYEGRNSVLSLLSEACCLTLRLLGLYPWNNRFQQYVFLAVCGGMGIILTSLISYHKSLSEPGRSWGRQCRWVPITPHLDVPLSLSVLKLSHFLCPKF